MMVGMRWRISIKQAGEHTGRASSSERIEKLEGILDETENRLKG